jgi:hypothetical protein
MLLHKLEPWCHRNIKVKYFVGISLKWIVDRFCRWVWLSGKFYIHICYLDLTRNSCKMCNYCIHVRPTYSTLGHWQESNLPWPGGGGRNMMISELWTAIITIQSINARLCSSEPELMGGQHTWPTQHGTRAGRAPHLPDHAGSIPDNKCI